MELIQLPGRLMASALLQEVLIRLSRSGKPYNEANLSLRKGPIQELVQAGQHLNLSSNHNEIGAM